MTYISQFASSKWLASTAQAQTRRTRPTRTSWQHTVEAADAAENKTKEAAEMEQVGAEPKGATNNQRQRQKDIKITHQKVAALTTQDMANQHGLALTHLCAPGKLSRHPDQRKDEK